MIVYRGLVLLFLLHLVGCKEKISSDDEIKSRISKIERLIQFKSIATAEASKDSLIVAFKLTQSVPSDSIKTKFFIKVLDKAIQIDNDSQYSPLFEALSLSNILNDTVSKAVSWSYGNFIKIKLSWTALIGIITAFKYYQSVNLPIYTGRMLYNMANIQWRQGDYTGSEINTFKAISRLKPLKYSKGLYLCYNHLGVLYMGMGEYDRSLRFHYQALEYTKELNLMKRFTRKFHLIILGIYFENKRNIRKQ